MKVAELIPGQLYGIDPHPQICVVEWHSNEITIQKVARPIVWPDHGSDIKGRPALYFGVAKRSAPIPATTKKTWYKSHGFLISGQVYYVGGENIRHIWPWEVITEMIDENTGDWINDKDSNF